MYMCAVRLLLQKTRKAAARSCPRIIHCGDAGSLLHSPDNHAVNISQSFLIRYVYAISSTIVTKTCCHTYIASVSFLFGLLYLSDDYQIPLNFFFYFTPAPLTLPLTSSKFLLIPSAACKHCYFLFAYARSPSISGLSHISSSIVRDRR